MNTRNIFPRLKPSRLRGGAARPGVWPRAAALLMAMALLLGPLPVSAQETPPDPELQQIEKETARVALEKAKLELAEKAREARFPKPTSEPLAGTTTTNDVAFIEEHIQGHNSVNNAADTVAKRICGRLAGARTIVVHNQSSVGMLTTYAAGRKRIDALRKRYEYVIDEMKAALAKDPDREMPRPGVVETQDRPGGRLFGPVAALGAATSVVGSFVDFLSFFRSNVDIRGTTFSVNTNVFVSSLFDALRDSRNCASPIALYHPAAVPPNISSPAGSPLLSEIELLFARRDEAEDLKRRIDQRVARKRQQIEDLKKLISDAQKAIKKYEDELAKKGDGDGAAEEGGEGGEDPMQTIAPGASGTRGRATRRTPRRRGRATNTQKKPEPKPDPRPALVAEIRRHEKLIAELEADIVNLNEGARHLPGVNTQFENLLKDLLAVDANSGISLLTGYLLSESLQEVMKGDGSYWLVLDVVIAGGNRKVKSNLIWDVFRGGAKITHSGGAVVHFNLYDRVGASVLSGVHGNYLKYRSPDKIDNLGARP